VTNTATIPTPALACALLHKPHIWLLHEFVTLDHHFPYLLGERVSQHLIGRLSVLVIANSSRSANTSHRGCRFRSPASFIPAYPPALVRTE